jgi:hypothetical protein
MNCETKPEVLMAYLDGELDQIERGRVAEHIVSCASCRGTVNDLRAVSGALAKWPAPEPARLPSAQDLLATAGFEPVKKPASWSVLTSRWGQVAALVLVAGVTAVIVVPRLTSERHAPAASSSTAARADRAPGAVDGSTTQSDVDSGAVGQDGRLTTKNGAAESPEAPAAPPPPPATVEGKVGEEAQPPAPDARELEKTAPTTADDGVATGAAGGVAAGPPAEPPKLARTEADEKESPRDQQAVAQPAPAAATAARPAPGGRANEQENQIRRAVLRIESKDIDAVVNRIDAEARAANGQITRRGAVQSKQDRDAVTVEIEVPSETFDRAIARIRSLGTVTSETKSSVDISARLDELDDEAAAAKSADKDRAAKSKAEDGPAAERRKLQQRARKATIVVTVVKPN